jgi:hypothetical protein
MANGQLDRSTLAQIDGEPGDLLRRDAAPYWNALQRDFKRDMGFPIMVTEAYRSLETSRSYFFGRYRKTTAKTSLWYEGSYWVKIPGKDAAAIPGRSKHGDGLAVDVNVYSFTSAAYAWLARNAGRYGFGNKQGTADGEPWHWVFGETRPSITPAALDTEEIDDMPEYKDWSKESRDQLFLDLFGGGRQIQNWKGQFVGVGDIIRATEAIAERASAAAVSASDAVTPGIPGVKHEGATLAMARYGAELVQQVLKAQGEDVPGQDMNEEAIAEHLLPSLLAAIAKLPAGSVEAIAKATVAQLGKSISDTPV